MNGREVFKFATRVLVDSAEKVLGECGVAVEDVDVYVPHQANVRIIDYARRKLGIPEERTVVNVDRYGNTSSGSIPLALGDAEADGQARSRRDGAADWNGSRPHVGLGSDRMDGERERWHTMSNVAFCFPGQGSLEVGMGREIAEAVPEAMEVFREGSEASGLDLQRLCFDAPMEELVETEFQQPALVATSLAMLAALRTRGLEPDYVVGHSVGEFTALAATLSLTPAESIGLVRERGLAMAEAARISNGSMAAILGLDDAIVEGLCAGHRRRLAGELQLPGPDRHLR